jgi:hypothetical protein
MPDRGQCIPHTHGKDFSISWYTPPTQSYVRYKIISSGCIVVPQHEERRNPWLLYKLSCSGSNFGQETDYPLDISVVFLSPPMQTLHAEIWKTNVNDLRVFIFPRQPDIYIAEPPYSIWNSENGINGITSQTL